jgi:hypothetical protein
LEFVDFRHVSSRTDTVRHVYHTVLPNPHSDKVVSSLSYSSLLTRCAQLRPVPDRDHGGVTHSVRGRDSGGKDPARSDGNGRGSGGIGERSFPNQWLG